MLHNAMSRILVVPLARLDGALADYQPSHLVSLLSPEHMIATPGGFPAARHLKLGVNDVADPMASTHPPNRAHIDALLAFARGWDESAPFLIHCWAGVSRSMAAAFTILCDRMGKDREIEIARAIRRRASHAAPNTLLVAHGDAALGRDGRMIAALNTMGPAATTDDGGVVEFPLVGL
jgi:predicted protein tyrosine phosphatase